MASNRSAVNSTQYPLAESDGRERRGTGSRGRLAQHERMHRWIRTRALFAQMKKDVDGCDA